MHIDALGPVNIGTRRGVHLEGRIDTPVGESNPIQLLLAILGKNCSWIAVKIKRQAGVVLNPARHPEPGSELVAKAPAHRVALILRIGKMTGGRYDRVVAEK